MDKQIGIQLYNIKNTLITSNMNFIQRTTNFRIKIDDSENYFSIIRGCVTES